MENSFTITVNCSSVLSNEEEGMYTMLVDNNKMKIVYELVEWIRWVFSIEKCIYLTSDNLVIQELEDIKILSKLKNLGIKKCGLLQCIHKKPYRSLLSKVGSLIEWNNHLVPKMFLEKITHLNEYPQNSSRLCLPAKQSSPLSQEEPVNTVAVSDVQNQEVETDVKKLNIGAEDSGIIQNHLEKSPRDLSCVATTQGNTELEVSNLTKFIPVNKHPEHKTFEWKTNGNEVAKNQPYNRCNKPFSLANVLSQLREEFQTSTTEDQSPESTSIPSNSFSFEKKTYDDNTGPKRKRKRVRRGGKIKKQKSTEFETSICNNYENAESSFNPTYFSSESKPNQHIRFDEDEEDDDHYADNVETNEVETDGQDSNNCDTQKNGFDFPNNPNKNVKELLGILNEKKKALSNVKTSPFEENPCKLSPITRNEAENCFSDTRSPEQLTPTSENPESKSLNQGLNVLLHLKEKFASPVVIERFN